MGLAAESLWRNLIRFLFDSANIKPYRHAGQNVSKAAAHFEMCLEVYFSQDIVQLSVNLSFG